VVRKKAALCLLRLLRKAPPDQELLPADAWGGRLAGMLEESDCGLLLGLATLLLGLVARSYEGAWLGGGGGGAAWRWVGSWGRLGLLMRKSAGQPQAAGAALSLHTSAPPAPGIIRPATHAAPAPTPTPHPHPVYVSEGMSCGWCVCWSG
jgi:hypothetical protein